jgi:hypothetical protein
MIIANLDGGFEGLTRSIEGNPIATLRDEAFPFESGVITDKDASGCWIELDYV